MKKKERISVEEAYQWLLECDEKFCPPKWTKDRLVKYAEKLATNAHWIFLENDEYKKGFVAYYLNENNKSIFISIIAVSKFYRGQGLGKLLMSNVVELISDKYNSISLEVSKDNISAKRLYESFGFEIVEDRGQKVLMNRKGTFS